MKTNEFLNRKDLQVLYDVSYKTACCYFKNIKAEYGSLNKKHLNIIHVANYEGLTVEQTHELLNVRLTKDERARLRRRKGKS